jgi:hypothetical protein
MSTYLIEYTDTFGGDANYSWVYRVEISAPANASRALLVRRAKAALGLKGRHRDVYDFGDHIQFDPVGLCARVFINYVEESTGN